MSCVQYNVQPVGVLDKNRTVFTHNPYWYEGFNAFALSPASASSSYPSPNYGYNYIHYEDQPPYPWSRQHWADRRLALRPQQKSLRTANLKYHSDALEKQRPFGKLLTPPTSDSASDQTMGYSDSERSDRDNEERDSHLEAQLVQVIVDYFGDCKGSLPSERVQNVIKKDFAELYEAVVVARYRKKWHKFLQHCSDTFHLFTRPAQPAPNQDYCWRIRLVNNPDWEEADQQDEEYRSRRDRELLDKVHAILSNSPDKQCLMIDVINEMNKDAKAEDNGKDDDDDAFPGEGQGRKARKIRAGDLKRLMRKCNSNFTIVEFHEGENMKRATFMKLIDPAEQQ